MKSTWRWRRAAGAFVSFMLCPAPSAPGFDNIHKSKDKQNHLRKAWIWPVSISKSLSFYLEKYIFLELTVLVAQWQLFRSIWSAGAALVHNSNPNVELMTVLDGQDRSPAPPPSRWAAVHSSDVVGQLSDIGVNLSAAKASVKAVWDAASAQGAETY